MYYTSCKMKLIISFYTDSSCFSFFDAEIELRLTKIYQFYARFLKLFCDYYVVENN